MCDYSTELQKAKSKAQNSNNLKEEASICNQLGALLSRNGKKIFMAIIVIDKISPVALQNVAADNVVFTFKGWNV